MDALDLLIEDCWTEILRRVKAPEDLKNCSETCLLFQEILRDQKNAFMFGLILPHLLRYLPAPDCNRFQLQTQQWKPLLKCRLICKRWCNSIDKLRDAECGYVFMSSYFFYSGERAERFLQMFGNHNGNPFLGRYMSLEQRSPLLLAENQVEGLDVDPVETFYIRKLCQLMERFRNEIWNVDMFEETDDEHVAYCKNIHSVLGYLPNLRTLRVQCNYDRGLILNVELDQEAELATYIASNPLPDVPQLKLLELSGVNVVMIRSILEKYAPQLKSLLVGNPSGFPEHCSRLGNLEELVLDWLDAGTSLNCLRQLQSPLRKLCLAVGPNSNNVDLWAIDELFLNISHLPIEFLFIAIRNDVVFLGESRPISADHRPYHASITSVDLRFPPGSMSFNFLMYCPKLESIFMEQDHPPHHGVHAGHPNGIVESLDVSGLVEQVGYDLYQSNIWENLPSLKSFKFHNCVGECSNWRLDDYERVEYEKRQNAALEYQYNVRSYYS